jgi:hypothetical protein
MVVALTYKITKETLPHRCINHIQVHRGLQKITPSILYSYGAWNEGARESETHYCLSFDVFTEENGVHILNDDFFNDEPQFHLNGCVNSQNMMQIIGTSTSSKNCCFFLRKWGMLCCLSLTYGKTPFIQPTVDWKHTPTCDTVHLD